MSITIGAALGLLGGMTGMNMLGDAIGKAQDFGYNSALANQQYNYNKDLQSLQQGYNLELQSNNQEFNSAEAQKARDWQTAMSNSEYSRRVADLKNAGLNPALAYMKDGLNGAQVQTTGGGVVGASDTSSGDIHSSYNNVNPREQYSAFKNLSSSIAKTYGLIRSLNSAQDTMKFKKVYNAVLANNLALKQVAKI